MPSDRKIPPSVFDQLAPLFDELAKTKPPAEAPVQDREVARRRWFGLAMIGLAVFCVGIAAVPWPGKVALDIAIWITFALLLLIVGGWNIDRAARDSRSGVDASRETTTEAPAAEERGSTIRRVK